MIKRKDFQIDTPHSKTNMLQSLFNTLKVTASIEYFTELNSEQQVLDTTDQDTFGNTRKIARE